VDVVCGNGEGRRETDGLMRGWRAEATNGLGDVTWGAATSLKDPITVAVCLSRLLHYSINEYRIVRRTEWLTSERL
jgi:hypothetical protein